MKIQCILVRAGGTRIDLDGTKYHFAPISNEPDAPHVATVVNPAHQKILLGITEAYQFYADTPPARDAQPGRRDITAVSPKPAQTKPISETAPVAKPAEPADGEDQGPNGDEGGQHDPEGKPEKLTDAQRKQMAEELAELSDDALAEEHKRVLGRAPNHTWPRETVINRIIDAPKAN